jgi:hypothetical protein
VFGQIKSNRGFRRFSRRRRSAVSSVAAACRRPQPPKAPPTPPPNRLRGLTPARTPKSRHTTRGLARTPTHHTPTTTSSQPFERHPPRGPEHSRRTVSRCSSRSVAPLSRAGNRSSWTAPGRLAHTNREGRRGRIAVSGLVLFSVCGQRAREEQGVDCRVCFGEAFVLSGTEVQRRRSPRPHTHRALARRLRARQRERSACVGSKVCSRGSWCSAFRCS